MLLTLPNINHPISRSKTPTWFEAKGYKFHFTSQALHGRVREENLQASFLRLKAFSTQFHPNFPTTLLKPRLTKENLDQKWLRGKTSLEVVVPSQLDKRKDQQRCNTNKE